MSRAISQLTSNYLTMPRTNTTALQSFTRKLTVTYDMPDHTVADTLTSKSPRDTPEADRQFADYIVTIHLPPQSKWTSALHYHTSHREYLRVLRGQALVTLISGDNRSTKIYTRESGTVQIDKYVVHEWRRAFDEGEEVMVQEWTDPADGAKEVFFRNLNSVIPDAEMSREGLAKWISLGWWVELQILVIGAGMDNYPVFLQLLGTGVGMRMMTAMFLWIVTQLGSLLGLRTWYEEYTPARLRPGMRTKLI